jgi:phosphatidylinositol glycan class Z
MLLLRWLWIGNGNDGEIPPIAVFWTLRLLMFIISFVLEDWAIHELVHSPRHRRVAVILVASSYVTWTYQTHTFSNSIETLVVAWSLVLIDRIVSHPVSPRAQQRPSPADHMLIPVITAAFIRLVLDRPRNNCRVWRFQPDNLPSVPVDTRCQTGAVLLAEVRNFILIKSRATKAITDAASTSRPHYLAALLLSALLTTLIAVALDTDFYSPHAITWSDLIRHPVITPLNNFMYNISPSNLAQHGLHPWYQHLLVNLPQLLGPAAVLLFIQPHLSLRLYSAISGIFVLSIFQHQEARFLLPTIPLILSSVQLPKRETVLKVWVASWIIFNIIFGVLMGIYHQGGIVAGQVFMSKQPDATQAIWWKTYMPPIWLLDGKNEVLRTQDVMGMKGELLFEELDKLATCDTPADRRNNEYLREKNGTYLIAPLSADWLDPYLSNKGLQGLRFREVWRCRHHLNLDDLDFAEDGVWNTLTRVVGRRGLAAWRVTKSCPGGSTR